MCSGYYHGQRTKPWGIRDHSTVPGPFPCPKNIWCSRPLLTAARLSSGLMGGDGMMLVLCLSSKKNRPIHLQQEIGTTNINTILSCTDIIIIFIIKNRIKVNILITHLAACMSETTAQRPVSPHSWTAATSTSTSTYSSTVSSTCIGRVSDTKVGQVWSMDIKLKAKSFYSLCQVYYT